MELLCPHCMKRVTVSDDKAGQVLNCPLCQGVFAAPSLAPPAARTSAPLPPTPSLPAAPPLEIPMQPLNVAPPPLTPPSYTPSSYTPSYAPAPPPPPKPAPPPADYSQRYAFRLRSDVLVCIPPACLFLILFVLSFFPWHVLLEMVGQGVLVTLWGLAFGDHMSGLFLAYWFISFLTLLVAGACMVLELGLLPAPPQLAVLMPWKSGITFGLLLLTWMLIGYDYQQGAFAMAGPSPLVLGEKLAFRLHTLALVASGLELWVQSRIARNLPLPRFSLRL